ncbi:uncharacterized protein LOC125428150 isoform X1 [Sphaerodactylus townsendi]|uniref:uncharacterized protein LOC125428150 isoform X1 n=2 Tax=Sphaerodactylus townsendi TaxID=933632 RepID=UPI0020275ED7|nr:uncharacterized protein LOC125428150 isoform X1 [Sphaerodactylus townsendi]
MNKIAEVGLRKLWSLVAVDPGVLSHGRSRLQRVHELARHPRYGLCWTRALGQLDVGCQELDEEWQSRIALAFAHCHLERSGKSFPPCAPASSIQDCTQDMDPVAFGVYTEFFTHAQSICYFLQNEAWQQRAQDTVLRLTSASEDVAHQLESTNQLAEETARAQNATLRSQERILQDGELLRQVLQDSSQGIRQAFQDLQNSAVEQRVVFAEIFNHVAFLHRFVVGKSNAVYSVLFHLLSVVAVLTLTSSQRTSGARFILLALVGANIYLESVICSLLMGNSDGGHDLTEKLSFWVGLSRWGFAALGLAVVAYFVWSYEDPVRQSWVVLESLQETQVEFQRLLQETERLLAERDQLPRGPRLYAESEASFDSGVPEQLSSCQDCRAEEVEVQAERHQVRASTPKRRGRFPSRTSRSPSRQRGRTWSVPAEPLTIPVPLERPPQYSLRSRRCPATPRHPNDM